jgi:hypothetical protein
MARANKKENVEISTEENVEISASPIDYWAEYNKMRVEVFTEQIETHKTLSQKAFIVIDNILSENTSPKTEVQQKMLETAIKLYEAFK